MKLPTIRQLLFMPTIIVSCLSCSCSPKLLQDMTDSERRIFVTEKIMSYMESVNDKGRDTYYMAYNREFSNVPHKRTYGAFDQTNVIMADTLMVESSFFISNSEKMYNESPECGVLHQVGIQFKINEYGDILDHTYYVAFDKNNHSEFYYNKDEYPIDIETLYIPTTL